MRNIFIQKHLRPLILGLIVFSWAVLAQSSEIDFSQQDSFTLVNSQTNEQVIITAKEGRKIKIIAQNKWAYLVKVYNNGVASKETYYLDKNWQNKMVNFVFAGAQYANKIIDLVRTGTNAVTPVCPPRAYQKVHPQSATSPYNETLEEEADKEDESSFVPESRIDEYVPGEQIDGFMMGCEALAKGDDQLADADQASLAKCADSIQQAITSGARNGDGSLNRENVYRNLYSRLNPKEQRFAAFIFTAQGEALNITRANPPALEEMQAVMKVIENRKNNANNKAGREKYNELDMALQNWQFSMYNANDNGWKNVLDPNKGANFSEAIAAYIGYGTAEFKPKPQVDNAYHYHTNYINYPNWAERSKEMRVTVDDKTTRPFTTASKGNNGRIAHIFYHNVAWPNSPSIEWRE